MLLSNARPSDEKLATCPRPAFVSTCSAPIAMPTSRPARRAASSSTAAAVGNDDDGRGLVLGHTQRPGRERVAVEDDRGCAGARRCECGRLRIRAGRHDDRLARDEAETFCVEVVDALRSGEARRRAGSRDPEAQRMARRDGAEQRHLLVEDHVEAAAQDDAHMRQIGSRVGGAHRERAGRAGRAGDRAERRSGAAVVAGGRDDDGVQVERALDGLGLGPVGERRVRLGDAEERDAHGIVRVAVAVRVDRALEAGDQLVRAGEHDVAPVGGGLPARDADRQDGRARRHAVQAARPAGADEDSRQLGAVALDLRRILRIRARRCVVAVTDDVDAREARGRAGRDELRRRRYRGARS